MREEADGAVTNVPSFLPRNFYVPGFFPSTLHVLTQLIPGVAPQEGHVTDGQEHRLDGQTPWFVTPASHPLATPSRASDWMCLCLDSFICIMGIMIVPTS